MKNSIQFNFDAGTTLSYFIMIGSILHITRRMVSDADYVKCRQQTFPPGIISQPRCLNNVPNGSRQEAMVDKVHMPSKPNV